MKKGNNIRFGHYRNAEKIFHKLKNNFFFRVVGVFTAHKMKLSINSFFSKCEHIKIISYICRVGKAVVK